jgi:aminoglycoside phosphotransferase (APT) family kinase protein
MKRAVDRIHNHSLGELSELLYQAWPGLSGKPSLGTIYSGGLSNVNIVGSCDGLDFVLKMPWTVTRSDKNPFEQLYRIADYVSQSGFGPRPLAIGQLNDEQKTPFIVFGYLEGAVYSSVDEMSFDQKRLLRKTHQEFTSLEPPGVPEFATPQAYVDSVFRAMTTCVGNYGPVSNWTQNSCEFFMGLHESVTAACDSVKQWSGGLMHGDLHEGNIVFSGEQVRFLDLEECALGSPFLDLAYLRVQQLPSHPVEVMTPLLADVEASTLRAYEPLALIFAISWTLEHLAYFDTGSVDSSLMQNYSQAAMREYADAKMKELKGYFS